MGQKLVKMSRRLWFTILILVAVCLILYYSHDGQVSMRSIKLNINKTAKPHHNVSECRLDVPCMYADEVKLRLIIMVYDRAESLKKVLQSLKELKLDGDSASIEIWIDVNKTRIANEQTLKVARDFAWKYGPVSVHIQPDHAGIYGQWIDTWRPHEGSDELALFLEDDVDLSPFAYRWLKAAHSFYGSRPDIAGYALYEGAIVKMNKLPAQVAFLHSRFGTQGFAPHPQRWREFQDWYHSIKQNHSFHPYVENDPVITAWYKSFEKSNKSQNMWSMWFIYFTDRHKLWTLYSNVAAHIRVTQPNFKNSYLAYHRQEKGLHFAGTPRKSRGKLITKWQADYMTFSNDIPKYSYNGRKVN